MKYEKTGTLTQHNAGHKVSVKVFFKTAEEQMINRTECFRYVSNNGMNLIVRYSPKREGTRFLLNGKFIFEMSA